MRKPLSAVLTALLSIGTSMAFGAAAPTSNLPAAIIDGQPILVSELENKAAADLAREDASYRETLRRAEAAHKAMLQSIREATLESMIRSRTLEAEAAKTGKSAEDILAAHAAEEPTEEAMRAYYTANATPNAPPFEQVKTIIHDRLLADARQHAEEDLARQLRSRHAVEWRLPRERVKVDEIGPVRGPASAPVTLVEFADFQCPYCNRLQPVLRATEARYPNQVRLVFRQLPIPQLHPSALLAAQMSVCAQEQDRFWPVHDALFALFSNKGALDGHSMSMLGEASGLEVDAFSDCLKSGRADAIITRDTTAADQLGIEGTPALFLNGRPLRGGVSEDSLRDAIDEELARLAQQSQ